MLPHSFLWGHLIQVQSVLSQLPNDAHITHALSQISDHFPKSDSLYYLDMWPFSRPLIVLSSPASAHQAIQQFTLHKPAYLMDVFHPITGGPDLIFMNGEQWKRSRSIFNPAFNPSYLVGRVPAIVEEVVTFKEKLRNFCQTGEMIQLDPVTLDLTLDVIVRITLYVSRAPLLVPVF